MKTMRYLTILFTALFLCGCDSIWDLNMDPGKPVYDGVGKEGIIRGNLTAAYSMLLYSDIFGEYYWGQLGGMDTDESFRYNVSNQTNIPNAHNITSSATSVRDMWKDLYKVNEFCNTAIMMCETTEELSETEIKDIKGQAMVLKAFAHFTLACNFGPVPIKKDASYDMGLVTDLKREPVKDVCQYALDLCREAVSLLPSIDQTRNSGVITKSAAEALSYRIALYMASHPDIQDVEKYDKVVEWADEFIANGPNKLNTRTLTVGGEEVPAYARLFVNNMMGKAEWDNDNPEVIWTIMFFCKSVNSGAYAGGRYKTAMRLGSQMGIPCPDRTSNSKIGYSDNAYRALNNLWDKYVGTDSEPYPWGDLRRSWNIPDFCYKNITGDKLAEGFGPETRYEYFKVFMPEGITCTKEAVFLPSFDKSSWTYTTGNVIDMTVDDPGEGYMDAKGNTTFTVTIPKTSRPATMADFNKSLGGIIGFRPGANLDTASGHQKVNASNDIDAVVIEVVNGKVVSASKSNPKAASIGRGFSVVNERGIGKWRREYEVDLPPIREQSITSCHFPYLRFADVLLMASEAHLMGSTGNYAKGLEYINMVRRRAYGLPVDEADSRVDAQSYNLQYIMDERSRELCFEGVRRNDLIRWDAYVNGYKAIEKVLEGNPKHSYINHAIEKLGTDYKKYSLLPIPSDEMGLCADTFYQNSGW
ncbi:MAG: RagB/SusD family nutrient uptake outer membrane protein [Bacteroidales bacterium]|nr:RagB/SusD family nutrient uptake outer membrane protein [Bacteroidales bacterium]